MKQTILCFTLLIVAWIAVVIQGKGVKWGRCSVTCGKGVKTREVNGKTEQRDCNKPKCPDPCQRVEIMNGHLTLPNRTEIPSMEEYPSDSGPPFFVQCDQFYETREQEVKVKCRKGAWMKRVSKESGWLKVNDWTLCRDVPCDFNAPRNGTYYLTDNRPATVNKTYTKYDGTLELKCHRGYRSEGDYKFICDETKWRGQSGLRHDLPDCTPVPCVVNSVQGGRFWDASFEGGAIPEGDHFYTWYAAIQLHCDQLFEYKGLYANFTCENGEWRGHTKNGDHIPVAELPGCTEKPALPRYWGAWSEWSRCYGAQECTQETGYHYRSRRCITPRPPVKPGFCNIGLREERQNCTASCRPTTTMLPTNIWGDWGPWTQCVNNAAQECRTRQCLAEPCEGSTQKVRARPEPTAPSGGSGSGSGSGSGGELCEGDECDQEAGDS